MFEITKSEAKKILVVIDSLSRLKPGEFFCTHLVLCNSMGTLLDARNHCKGAFRYKLTRGSRH